MDNPLISDFLKIINSVNKCAALVKNEVMFTVMQ